MSSRNGTTPEAVLADAGLAMPRDRNGSLGPQSVGKSQTGLGGSSDRCPFSTKVALPASGVACRAAAGWPEHSREQRTSLP
jgi:hypothetical protein